LQTLNAEVGFTPAGKGQRVAAKAGFFNELKRRNVFRMAGLYVAAGWLVVEVAGTVLPMFDVPGWIGRSLVIVIAIGFLPAMLFAWVFEVTPDGLKREDEIPAELSITHHTARRMDIALIAVVVLLVGYIAVDKLVLVPKRDDAGALTASETNAAAKKEIAIPDKSIAVLPFRNEGGKDDEQYFSDGLSEDLITALSKFDGLKVIARDSAFRFRDSKEGSKAIATQLGVAHLLSGSVRRLGETVRISATLVNAKDGSSLWSENYDRPFKDLFALQDDITKAVSGELQAKLMPAMARASQSDRPPSGNLAAYEALLKGNYEYVQRNGPATQRAITAYEQAIALDPAYAYAHARLARALVALMANFSGSDDAEIAKARQAVATALRLEPDSAEAHKSYGRVLWDLDNDIAGATREVDRALALAPQDAEALVQLGTLQASVGELALAEASYQRALALDPLSSTAGYNLGANWLSMGEYAKAEQMLQRLIRQNPESAANRIQLAIAQIGLGRSAEAVATARSEPDPFWRTVALALAYWANGEHAQSDAALQQLIKENADDGGSQIAQIYAQRGDADQAFKWLEHARASGDGGVAEMRGTPFLLRYRDDPRFIAMARELGLMPEDPGPTAKAATDANADGVGH